MDVLMFAYEVGLTGEWRKLHNEKLHILYSSPNIIRQIKSKRMGWAGHVARMGEERNLYRVLMGKPEGKRPLSTNRNTDIADERTCERGSTLRPLTIGSQNDVR
jgi:hypothetical protein